MIIEQPMDPPNTFSQRYQVFQIQVGRAWYIEDHNTDKYRLLHDEERMFAIHNRGKIDD